MIKMVKETKKKKQAKFQGNSFNQNLDSIKFAKDYQTWKDNCQGISGETLMVENVPSLYDFLFPAICKQPPNHFKNCLSK